MNPPRTLLALISLLLFGCLRHEPCTVTGTLRSCSGQNIVQSTVRLLGGFHQPGQMPGMDDMLIAQSSVGSEGHFSLSVPSEGAFRLVFTGVRQSSLSVPLVTTGETHLEVSVRLKVAPVDSAWRELRIKYAFDDGPLDHDTSLIRREHGSLGLDLESAGHTCRFGVVGVGENNDTRSFEGTEADHFELLSDGGYVASVRPGLDGICHLVIHTGSSITVPCGTTLQFRILQALPLSLHLRARGTTKASRCMRKHSLLTCV